MSYLFCHFIGESEYGEQVYFSLSRDGLHYEDVAGGRPVLISDLGTGGVRDPFILRSRIDGCFYILATDLRIYASRSWEAAVHQGSRKMILWKSKDLVHWSKPWAYDVPLEKVGCVWAPETFYDEKREEYMVFWASFRMEEGKPEKHIIYRAQTRDFWHFSEPAEYMERSCNVIDTTIFRSGGEYYRFSKDEDSKGIVIDHCADLQGEFQTLESSSLSAVQGVEGPLVYKLPDGRNCLMVDRFLAHAGYLPILFEDGDMTSYFPMKDGEFDLGKNLKRHGSVLEISEEEYQRVRGM